MDSDTRRFDAADAARVPGSPTMPMPPIAPVAPVAPEPPPSIAPVAGLPPVAPPLGNGTYPSPTVAPRPVAPPMFGGSNILPLALIVLGVLLFAGQFTGLSMGSLFGSAIVLAIGLVFLYVYYAQGRNFGFLVPGAILTGLGAGIVATAMGFAGGWVPVGLGLGFCAIWFLHREHWWALIPGGIITLAGLSDVADTTGWSFGNFLHGQGFWAFMLVIVGLWLIASRNNSWRRR